MACEYTIKDAAGNDITFKDQKSLIDYIRSNQLYQGINRKGTPDMTTNSLANVLRQMSFGEHNFDPKELKAYQEELLDKFILLEDQSQYFYKLGAPVTLTKGAGKSFDSIDTVKRNLKDLGIGQKELPGSIPFDVRHLLTGDSLYREGNLDQYHHKLTANNIGIANEIDALARTMFMERTPSFMFTSDRVSANLKANIQTDKVREMRDELSAFAQLAAYKQWILLTDKRTSTLRNSLIYDIDTNTPTIVDIANEAVKIAPENIFLQFILPVSTTLKVGKKKQRNILNRDLINTIEGKTRGKLEPDLISSLMDSFTELYQNPRTQFHAKALFDYLIVKDGLMFKNKSFIKLVPTLMFKEVSNAAEIATKLMAANTADEFKRILKELAALEIVDREGNLKEYFSPTEKQSYNDMFRSGDILAVKNSLYQRVFGMNYNNLYHNFEKIYASDVRNQFNLELIKPKIKNSKGVTKTAEGIIYAKDENTNTEYLHISLFTDKFKATEKESKERKEAFKTTVDELNAAGFGVVSIGEGSDKKNYLEFKKFVRIRTGATASQEDQFFGGAQKKKPSEMYTTYQLIMVERDGKSYNEEPMTADGSYIPHGTYAVYQPIKTTGTSNSTGVANLGPRPTRDEILSAIETKLKRDDDNNTPPAAPLVPRTPTTPSGGGKTYIGPITSLKENQVFVFGSNPVGINGNPEKGTGGAALVANKNKWVEQGERMDNTLSKSGKAWGITTVTYPGRKRSKTPDEIKQGIKKLYDYAQANPNKEFLIAYMGKTGTNLNGYSNQELANMFSAFPIPSNIVFERDFNTLINRGSSGTQDLFSTPTQPISPTIQGGIFGGLQQLPYDPSEFDGGFDISDDDMNEALKDLDKC